ncbi:uncharacterized protein F5147DRAFT_56903 [Suillus discolor]|uniref:DUF6533 domain-containing protein n=1 Tax=Suillus discolor TaxID=1912936 RepID=A0A9P7JLW0_9AGAM|nr:uncharacterized protein F5147DRAFT_56903 [Suillus discolor]KAG2087833.1 hypothetical protein F5147DRAFT_56903 [Suillus discolor]
MSTDWQMQKSASAASAHLAVASFTLVVYDHIITFSQEVTFFWSGPWTTSRILYLSVMPSMSCILLPVLNRGFNRSDTWL